MLEEALLEPGKLRTSMIGDGGQPGRQPQPGD